MAVTVDAATEQIRTDTTTPQTWSHGGAASGVKGVIIAAIHNTSATDHVSAASYGGAALGRIQRNTETGAEAGAAELWFLGTSVPQGTQTASVTCGTTTDDFEFVVITLLADGDLEIVDFDGIEDSAVTNPSVTLQYGGRPCMAFAAFFSTTNAPADFTENGDCTRVADHDFGSQTGIVTRQTTTGTADFAIGGTNSLASYGFACMAVSEIGSGSVSGIDPMGTMGFFGI
jgi:hypothetical protein